MAGSDESVAGPRRLAVVFPGQGAQHVGMGRALCERFPVARETFAEASEALGYDLARLCGEGPEEQLGRTVHAQPAILTCSVAVWRVLEKECGLAPVLGAGHSLGEFSALACAGVLAFGDAVRLVEARGRFMQRAAPLGSGGMAAVFGLPGARVEALCAELSAGGERVWVANFNSAEQVVISGTSAGVKRACERLTAEGGVTHEMKISIPAHTALMRPAAEQLAEALARVPLADARFPVISNATVEPYQQAAMVRDNLVRQLTRPVQWRRIMALLAEGSFDAILEVGPRTVLRDLFKMEFPRTPCFAVGDETGVEAVRRFLARPPPGTLEAQPGWAEFLPRCLALAVATRNRAADASRYEAAVVEPYRKLEALRRAQREQGQVPTREQIRQGAELLRRILRSKKLPEPDRARRFQRLLHETGTAALLPDFEP